jgi:hypothetical protein
MYGRVAYVHNAVVKANKVEEPMAAEVSPIKIGVKILLNFD